MYLRPMRFFYAPEIATPVHALDESEARHLARVLRASVGEEVILTDGRGGHYRGVITTLDKRSCLLATELLERVPEPRPRLTMVVAPTKSTDRFEWFLEKATEIGVGAIQPVFTERSERKAGKPDRWERILVAAAKQSQRFWVPELRPALKWTDWLAGAGAAGAGFIAHCEPADDKPHLLRALTPGKDCWVGIGPEGDFTPDEISEALRAGAQAVSLGEARLRTETAALVAVQVVDLVQLP